MRQQPLFMAISDRDVDRAPSGFHYPASSRVHPQPYSFAPCAPRRAPKKREGLKVSEDAATVERDAGLFTRERTNALRSLLDKWLPASVRESAIFRRAVKSWLGRGSDADFKQRAFRMSPHQFRLAYESLGGKYVSRGSDTTLSQVDWVLANIGDSPLEVLEIGPGKGLLSARMRNLGYRVLAVDIFPANGDPHYIQGTVDNLPLADKSVDVIVLAHVIEHVQSLTRAFVELERVARNSVLIVTPKQRYFRYTFDYHLHFFYSVDHLASHIHRGSAGGCEIDRDLCLIWDVR